MTDQNSIAQVDGANDTAASRAPSNGRDPNSPFLINPADRLPSQYSEVSPLVEAVTPSDPAALDQALGAIFRAGLSPAEREMLLREARSKSQLDARAFGRVLRSYADNGHEEQVAARPMSNPDPALTGTAPLAKLAGLMITIVDRQVAMSHHAVVACVLWIIAAYGARLADLFPRLIITSPTKECGKSTLLELVLCLSPSPLKADNVSVSALFRLIDSSFPTLGIDEVDSFIKQDSDIPNVLNSGHAHSGCVVRSESTRDGKSWVPRSFSTFAPLAMAGIGKTLPPTSLSRAIILPLERAPVWVSQPDGSKTRRRRRLKMKDLATIRQEIVPHLLAHAPAIGQAVADGLPETSFPDALGDRAAENWEPLFAVADLLGGDWPRQARAAALALAPDADDGQMHRDLLLADLRDIWREKRAEVALAVRDWWDRTGRTVNGRGTSQSIAAWYARQRQAAAGQSHVRPSDKATNDLRTRLKVLQSDELVRRLNDREDRPWAGYQSRDGGITREQVARLLKPYGVKPRQRMDAALGLAFHGDPRRPVRGYFVDELSPVWKKYRGDGGP